MSPTPETASTVDALRVLDSLDEPTAGRIAAVLGVDWFEVVAGPRTGLVMMTVSDPFDTAFHLGEVLVTEAAVQAGDVRGWGMAVGEVPQRALLKAILDALARAGDVAGLQRAAALLAPEQSRMEAERRRESELVARTHVRFDLMPGAQGT